MPNEPTLEEALRVLKLSNIKRYKYFIERIVETGVVHAIAVGNEYVMLDDDSGKTICCPLWPGVMFAELWAGPEAFAPHQLLGSEVAAFELDVMLNEFLPDLRKQDLEVGICFDRTTDGPVVPVDKVIADIQNELNKTKRALH